MFDALRQAFREAVDNFRTELNRDAVPEKADGLIRAMEKEVVEARLILDRLAADIDATKRQVEEEDTQLQACLRREAMAQRIGDTETETVAREFAARHLQRKDVLEDKLRVLERERTDRVAEVEGMMKELKGAQARRAEMTAAAGRADARERLQGADDLFADLDRMAERIGDLGHEADAAASFTEDSAPPARDRNAEAEARLRILKERMGKDG